MVCAKNRAKHSQCERNKDKIRCSPVQTRPCSAIMLSVSRDCVRRTHTDRVHVRPCSSTRSSCSASARQVYLHSPSSGALLRNSIPSTLRVAVAKRLRLTKRSLNSFQHQRCMDRTLASVWTKCSRKQAQYASENANGTSIVRDIAGIDVLPILFLVKTQKQAKNNPRWRGNANDKMLHINSSRHRDCVGCGLLLSAAFAPDAQTCIQCGDITCANCTVRCDVCHTTQVCVNCMLECRHVHHKGDSRICAGCARPCPNCRSVMCRVCERRRVQQRATCNHCHRKTEGECPSRLHECTLCKRRGCSACVLVCRSARLCHTVHTTCASLRPCVGCARPLATCVSCVTSCNQCHQPLCDDCAPSADHCANCQRHADSRHQRTCLDCQQSLCSACSLELLEPGTHFCARCLTECRLCGATVRRRFTATGRFQDVCTHCADYMTHTLTERLRRDIVHATGWPVCVASIVLLFLQVNCAFVERPR